MYKKIQKVHFVGIGGIGMSGIAELLHRHAYGVTGSDRSENESIRFLRELGVKVFLGHHASHVEGAELLVISSAIKPDNPEVAQALQRQIPVIPRAEMLAELMRIKYGIAVAGAHGKTTTTSMISWVLVEAGLDPTIVVGGRMDNFGGTNSRLGSGEFMVVEADESDGSFNKLSPSIAIVTNLDREHMEHYRSMQNLRSAFKNFLNKVPFYGLSILCLDDPTLRMIKGRLNRRVMTYGFHPEADYRIMNYAASERGSIATVQRLSDRYSLELQVPGKHNMLNALATIAVADELSVPTKKTVMALSGYQGVQRRFQFRGKIGGVFFVDDYAHHPTEIRATIVAARERYPASKLYVVFQPHRYSRSQDLFDDFTRAFDRCDRVFITDIYAAGEPPIDGVTANAMVEGVNDRGFQAEYTSTPKEAIERCLSLSQPNDVVLTLGAGDLPNVYRSLF